MIVKSPAKTNSASATAPPRQLVLLLTALRRHGLWAGLTGLVLASAAVAAVWFTFEPQYEAKAFLHVIQNPEYFQILPERSQGKTDSKSELAPLLSEIVLRDVLVDEEVQRQPSFAMGTKTTKDLRKMLKFQSAGGAEHYEVVATSPHPKEAVTVVTKATAAFLDFFREYRNARLQELGQSLSDEIKTKNQQIEQLNREMAGMIREMQGSTSESPLFDPEGQFLSELKKSRTEMEVNLQIAQQQRQSIAQALEQRQFPVDEAVVVSMVEQSRDISTLRARVEELDAKLTRVDNKGRQHPANVEMARERQLIVKQLAQNRTRLLEQIRQSMEADAINRINAQLQEADKNIQQLQTQIAYYDQEIKEQYSTIMSSNEKRSQYESKQAELERLRGEHTSLIAAESAIRLRKLSLPYQISQSSAEVVTPTDPIEKYPLKLMGMAGAVALVIPFALAFLWEMRAQRVTSGEEVSHSNQIPILGEVATLPKIRRSGKQYSVQVSRHMRLYQESVDNISAMLTVDQANRFRTISLTSALSHEGKSTLSSQLAISMARGNQHRVLLIDTDLRSPVQHRLFDLDLGPGLAEVLEQELDWQSTVRETDIDNLSIITAGRVKSNPLRCFSGENWSNLLKEVQQDYDVVIVDTPPVLATSESMVICQSTSATLVCLLRDVSRSESVQRACQRLVSAGANVHGCVMSGVPQRAYANRYGSYGYNLTR
jgi:capsular exopolysaccharide synthesis family protein